jgi:ubiquinone/menaquinone biosynthesis C-methylase UbiE
MDDDPIALCLAGRISPPVALWRLACRGLDAQAIVHAAAHADPSGRSALAAFVARYAPTAAALNVLLRSCGVDHRNPLADPAEEVQRIAAFFDRAAEIAPDAGVAAYTLGDTSLTEAARQEIIDWLLAINAVQPSFALLDFGCGVGRLTSRLSSHCREIVGLDVSTSMIAEARRRHGAITNARFSICDGVSLRCLALRSFNTVLAADVFPYLVQAGQAVAQNHVRDFARALRPRGRIVILNLSYRDDPAADLADARSWARDNALDLEYGGERPFELWDAGAFVLRVTPRDGRI